MEIKDHTQHIKDIKEISVAIDRWEDIFSDFDPSPLGQRTLSEDFISELKKRYRETKRGSFIITIYAPLSLKDEQKEKVVIQRLKQYFRFRSIQAKKQLGRIRARGITFVAFGTFSLGLLILLTYFKVFSELAIEMIGIALMPLGWFGIWEGFSKIVDASPILRVDEDLFVKLARANYRFKHVE